MSEWKDISLAAFGNPWKDDEPRMVVVVTRYSGVYEGGTFAAIPASELDGDAFGGDIEAAEWWEENRARVGVGGTPDDALKDWYGKRLVAAK